MYKFLIFLFALGLTLPSCDVIKGPYIENVVDTSCVAPTFTARTPQKKVLIEDYTGHQCGNCPRAHETATSLKNTYGEQVIVIADHAGYFAEVKTSGTKYLYEFKCPESIEIDQFFGAAAAGLPQGMVNRQVINNNKLLPHSSWASVVTTELAKAPVADVQIAATYNAADRKICTSVYSKWTASSTAPNLKLAAYILEDSIINYQKDYNASPTDIPQYVHKHTLRGGFAGSWGESVILNSNQEVIKTWSKTVPQEWNENHLLIVAYLYNADTYEILQVEEIHLPK